MKVPKKCVGCGEYFVPNCNAQKFCNKACREKTRNPIKKKILKKCVGCGVHFIPVCGVQKFCNGLCQRKTYYKENKERIKKKRHEHYEKNKEVVKERHKKYCEKNKERILKYRVEIYRAYISREFEFFYDEIAKTFEFPDPDVFKEKCMKKFLEIWEKIKKGTKFRSPFYLGPVFIYLFFKVNGIKISKHKIMKCSIINEYDFRRGLVEIVPMYTDYVKRDKRKIVIDKLIGVMREVDSLSNLQFAKTSKQIIDIFWTNLKKIREEIIVGIIILLSSVKMELNFGKFNEICKIIGVSPGSVHNALNNHIFTKKDGEQFRGLRKSSDLVKEYVTNQINAIAEV